MDDDHHDELLKVAAVMRRLYSQDRMSGDVMRNAAQLLDAALENLGLDPNDAARPHATYDARLR